MSWIPCLVSMVRARLFRRAVLAGIAALTVSLCIPSFVNAAVTSSGQFVTDIMVPAFHGLEPKLRLVYRASPVNGRIDAGWDLAGKPSYIVRASKGRGAPRFDGSDIFLLDGMELVPCAPASTSPSCTSAVAAFRSSNGFHMRQKSRISSVFR
jgi:hypothetical protein